MFLMIRPEGRITLGASMDGGNKFSGYLHSLQFFDKSFTEADVQAAYAAPSSTNDKITFDGAHRPNNEAETADSSTPQ